MSHAAFTIREVPPESLSDLSNFFETETIDRIQARLYLMNLFWIVNWLGFDLPRCVDDQIPEQFGPTVSRVRLQQLQQVYQCLVQCAQQKNLQPLNSFYLDQIPTDLKTRLENLKADSLTQVAIGRILMLLADKHDGSICKESIVILIDSHLIAFQIMAHEEQNCFRKHQLQAVTFLPALFWKLCSINSQKSLSEQVLIFIRLQTAIYRQLANMDDALFDGNRSIPMFSLTQDSNKEFLINFCQHTEYQLQLGITIGKFITITPRLIAPLASATPLRTLYRESQQPPAAGTLESASSIEPSLK